MLRDGPGLIRKDRHSAAAKRQHLIPVIKPGLFLRADMQNQVRAGEALEESRLRSEILLTKLRLCRPAITQSLKVLKVGMEQAICSEKI